MAEVVVGAEDRARIEMIAAELEAETETFFADVRNELSLEVWGTLRDYAAACVRRSLELGALLHAVVDAHGHRGTPYGRDGRAAFVRRGIDAWRETFAPIPEVWRLAEVFAASPGGEARIMADVRTLEVMAANRMFSSLEEQYARFIKGGAEGAAELDA